MFTHHMKLQLQRHLRTAIVSYEEALKRADAGPVAQAAVEEALASAKDTLAIVMTMVPVG